MVLLFRVHVKVLYETYIAFTVVIKHDLILPNIDITCYLL